MQAYVAVILLDDIIKALKDLFKESKSKGNSPELLDELAKSGVKSDLRTVNNHIIGKIKFKKI